MKQPKQLDEQSEISIKEWLDIDSEKCKLIDDNRSFTKQCLIIGFEDKFMFTDCLGRVWCKSNNKFFPFHLEFNNKKYGIKISKKAAN